MVKDNVTKEILYQGRRRHNELFQIPVFKFIQPTVQQVQFSAYLGQLKKSTLWHQRLGHPTNEVLYVMLRKSQIDNLVDDKCTMCLACIQRKMSKLPFPQESSRCLVPFEKNHSDIWGPSPVKSIE